MLKIERESDTISSEKSLYEIQFMWVKESFDFDAIKEKVLSAKPQEKKAFLRGIYLGCGIISNPPSYHLEFRFEKDDELSFVSEILSRFKIKHAKKPGRIYLKGRENIKDFLYLIGARDSYLELEEDAVQKSISNKINRLTNFEFANLKRQTALASEDIKAIKQLQKEGKFELLPKDMQEVALLRLEFPFLSLRELSLKTGGKYSKQEIYYKLKKIKSYGTEK